MIRILYADGETRQSIFGQGEEAAAPSEAVAGIIKRVRDEGDVAVLDLLSERWVNTPLSVDARGRVGLHMAVGGQWRECTSEVTVPLMTWVHVAGTFDAGSGLAVYLNGEKAGTLASSGSPTYADDVDLLIGRNHTKEPAMFSALWGAADPPVHFAFDGIIDEVKIHGRCLTADDVQKAFQAGRPSTPPNLKPRRMPSGPKDIHRFGAFYHHLKYCEEWDAIWRGSGPDVVVAFKFAPVRLVFWRGVSYAPCWVTEERAPPAAGKRETPWAERVFIRRRAYPAFVKSANPRRLAPVSRQKSENACAF